MKTRTVIQKGIVIYHIHGNIPPSFWSESYHSHDHAEIFIHITGQMELFIEGNVYHHNANEVRIYAPGELHFGKCDREQQMEWYQISLPPLFLKEHPKLADRIVNRQKGVGNLLISKKQDAIISLLEEILSKSEGALLEHYFYANVIKILCILNEQENNVEVQMGKNECLWTILESINQHIMQIKTIEDISGLTHFSASYIHQLFRKHLNITPHKYLTVKKMERARELLDGGASISEACFRSGFDNYANFITSFKKHFGVTPKNHSRASGEGNGN